MNKQNIIDIAKAHNEVVKSLCSIDLKLTIQQGFEFMSTFNNMSSLGFKLAKQLNEFNIDAKVDMQSGFIKGID